MLLPPSPCVLGGLGPVLGRGKPNRHENDKHRTLAFQPTSLYSFTLPLMLISSLAFLNSGSWKRKWACFAWADHFSQSHGWDNSDVSQPPCLHAFPTSCTIAGKQLSTSFLKYTVSPKSWSRSPLPPARSETLILCFLMEHIVFHFQIHLEI